MNTNLIILLVIVCIFAVLIIPSIYNKGWNDAIDEMPQAIVFSNQIKANHIPLDEMLQYEPGKPFFVLNQTPVPWSYKDEIIGQTLSLYKIIPKKKN